MQKIYDFLFRQIELSIREIGYGDVSVNSKMKNYVNLFHLILQKVEKWDEIPNEEKKVFFKNNLNIQSKLDYLLEYFDKYIKFLSNNPLNCFSKDVISFKF